MQSTQPDGESTTATSTTDWRARVAVRVPRNGGANLESDATRRLEIPAGIDRVEVGRLCGLEPALAATVAQFEVRVVTTCGATATTVESLLADAPGTERVEDVTRRS